MDYNTLVSKFPGYKGWGQTEALADFKATGGSGKGGSTGGSSTSSSGSSSFSMPDFNSFFNQQRQAAAEQAKQAKASEDEFLTRFRGALAGQEALPAMAARLGNELGVPALRENAFGLQQSLKAIPRVQTAATRGFDVNENQRQRIIAQKQSELAPAAQEATAQQQFAESQLAQQLGFAQQEQQKQLMPFQTEASMLSDRVAREITGYQQSQQGELNALLQQMSLGAQLSQAEMARATALAQQENQYKLQQQQLEAQYRYRPTDSSGLYDTLTGKIVGRSLPAGTTVGNIKDYLGGSNTTDLSKYVS